MTTETDTQAVHGGRLIAQRLRAHGVEKLFTLSGGHLFSIYDGCRAEGIELIDVRHEQTAAFAAEGWAKVTRSVGVCALTAGPGVTNGMSAIASASLNHSPVLVLGGRAPAFRWGQGSLQEIDHVPFVRPLVKSATTAESTARDPRACRRRPAARGRAADRADVLDFPLDYVFTEAEAPADGWRAAGPGRPLRPARDRARRRAAARRRAPRDHGWDRAVLGQGRGRAARAGRSGCACRYS